MRRLLSCIALLFMTGFANAQKLGPVDWILASTNRLSRCARFVDASAPLIEIRDDDLQAQRAMQRDSTLWIDAHDATWIAQMQRRFPEAHIKSASDPLSVHAVTRVLHYPGYIRRQIEYYHAQSEANPDGTDVADLMPAELITGNTQRWFEVRRGILFT